MTARSSPASPSASARAATDPTTIERQEDLFASYRAIGEMQERAGGKDEAKAMYCRAKAVVLAASALRPDEAKWRERLAWIEARVRTVAGADHPLC